MALLAEMLLLAEMNLLLAQAGPWSVYASPLHQEARLVRLAPSSVAAGAACALRETVTG